ncbi:AfsR/SARP family transcriptional regulator, partial [Crossiella equi]|uniref:AfsR/SARP family transcriptional regulator n=1 Tax=Crossiella equi TaxID=130796 RepID=UPI001177C6F6
MRIGVLGPVVAWHDNGTEADLGGPKARTLLALLATTPGATVPTPRLLEGLYGTRPPDGAPNALQSLISRLRRALGPDLVTHDPPGYCLTLPADRIDAHRAAALLTTARDTPDPAQAHPLLTEALTLWRGDPPPELGPHWAELRLATTEAH